jgi:SNF2 family DNA or RNA helicase
LGKKHKKSKVPAPAPKQAVETKYTLMAHQVEGVKFLKRVNGVGALLWDPGVGKTGATAAYLDHLVTKYGGELRVLVVAPLTAADTWVLQPHLFMDAAVKSRMLEGRVADQLVMMRQARNWTTVPWTSIHGNHGGVSGNRVTILSMSAGGVSSYCDSRPKAVEFLQAVRKYAPHMIVMDESHIIKADNSNISKAMYQIGQIAPHRIILTGTVNPKDMLDCYGQWRFLAPWTFSEQFGADFTKKPHKMTVSQIASIRPWSWDQFKTRYSTQTGYKGKSTKPVEDDYSKSDLYKRVAERSHNVRKEDALDLPPVTDIDVHIRLDAHEQRLYDEMLSDLAAMLANGELVEAPNALAKIMKLRQITAGFIRDTETEVVHAIGRTKQRAVAEIVNVRLHGEQRIVVFAYFKSECAALADMLRQKGRTVEVITGETKKNDRLAIRQRFADVSGNPEQVVLVAQQRTMSVSVNELVTAQNAVYASMSERRDDWVQSRGRLDRKGQVGQHVTFWNVYAPDTVDEVMLTTHKRRGNMEKALLDYIKSVSK